MVGGLPPLVVAASLREHPLLQLLSTSFTLRHSPTTFPNSLLSPTTKSSCLLVDSTTMDQDLQSCRDFLEHSASLHPFLLATPLHPSGSGSLQQAAAASRRLCLDLRAVLGWAPTVVTAATVADAREAVVTMFLSTPPPPSLAPAPPADVAAALAGPACRDRVEASLLLCEAGSLAGIPAVLHTLDQETRANLETNGEHQALG